MEQKIVLNKQEQSRIWTMNETELKQLQKNLREIAQYKIHAVTINVGYGKLDTILQICAGPKNALVYEYVLEHWDGKNKK